MGFSTSSGNSTLSRSHRSIRAVRAFVSVSASEQNSVPVQAIAPRWNGFGSGVCFDRSGSANRSSKQDSGTSITSGFCRRVSLTSPDPYSSAKSASSMASSAVNRPTATERPT